MRWPWQKDEPPRATRQQSGGDFSDAVVRLLEQTASGASADTRSTAATESAAGHLSRAFAAAEVVAPPWVQQAVSPTFLMQVGRDLVRGGDSLHVIRVNDMGKVALLPCSSWHFEEMLTLIPGLYAQPYLAHPPVKRGCCHTVA